MPLPPYCLIRPFIHSLPPETAHHLTILALRTLGRTGFLKQPRTCGGEPIEVMGLSFPNRVGLAAGLDKNAKAVDGLAALGFGFIEVGTVTPRAQPGNARPRLFRLSAAQALINRMGFNNDGVDVLVSHLEQSSYQGVLGINIGKNFDTPLEDAVKDYTLCMRKVYHRASYLSINISSPNTPGLRALQEEAALGTLLSEIHAQRQALADEQGRYVPVVIKVSPDNDDAMLIQIAQTIMRNQMDGIIATNTTLSRQGVEDLPGAREEGGLSGSPLFERACHSVRQLALAVDGALPIIGVGGITSAKHARLMLEAGASLLQIYTGLIYHGAELIDECLSAADGYAQTRQQKQMRSAEVGSSEIPIDQ